MSVDKSFWRQMTFEAEGSAAALAGKCREDCPYSETGDEEDKFRWNHWVFGFDVAFSEMEVLRTGEVRMMSVGAPPDYPLVGEWTETAEEAYRNGNWEPRYVKVPDEWKARRWFAPEAP